MRNVFLFLGAWSTAKIPMMLFEITQLGSTFTIVRFCFNLAGTVLLALFLWKKRPLQKKRTIYANALPAKLRQTKRHGPPNA